MSTEQKLDRLASVVAQLISVVERLNQERHSGAYADMATKLARLAKEVDALRSS